MKLSKNSWHYKFWTKCMKNDVLHAFFGVRTHWDDALWDECYEQCDGGTITEKRITVNQLYDQAMDERKIPQDLCTYMRNMMLMCLIFVISGSIVALLSLITIIGFVVIPFSVMGYIWANLFVESYQQMIALGVIAWFALLVYGVGITLLKIAKLYADNRYKDGTISSWIHNFKIPNLKPKVSLKKEYKQPWYYIVYQYYCSIKEKTCKKIEFED